MPLPKSLTTVTPFSKMIALLLFILLPFGGFVLGMKYQQKVQQLEMTEPPSVDEFQTPQRVTMAGTFTCLPHRDTSGPQTMECAFGLQTDEGLYYALDFSLSSQEYPNYATGQMITVSGVLTPIEYLSSDHWQKYNVEGIVSVTDAQQ